MPSLICLAYYLKHSTSLQEMGPDSDNVVLAFEQLKGEYNAKFGEAFPRVKR